MTKRSQKYKRIEHLRSSIEPYDRILIVCEGDKTEPTYFSRLIKFLELSTANVHVIAADGSDPKSVAKSAKAQYQKLIDIGEYYNRVYCVFDRDEHSTFKAAVKMAKANNFYTAYSVPCFEYWLLLHFKYSRAPFSRSGSKSASQNCASELTLHLPAYSKNLKEIYDDIFELLDVALHRARIALQDVKETGEENPSTLVHKLVENLQRQKNP